MAAGSSRRSVVFGHGFVYKKNEPRAKSSAKARRWATSSEPMDLITKFNAEAFRYYFLRECPFPGDGEFSLAAVRGSLYNADLANNLGNLYSRLVTLIAKNFDGKLPATAGRSAAPSKA